VLPTGFTGKWASPIHIQENKEIFKDSRGLAFSATEAHVVGSISVKDL
jgi:hypothetical protein